MNISNFKQLLEYCENKLTEKEFQRSTPPGYLDPYFREIMKQYYPKILLEKDDFQIIKIPPTPYESYGIKIGIKIRKSLIDKLTHFYPETLV